MVDCTTQTDDYNTPFTNDDEEHSLRVHLLSFVIEQRKLLRKQRLLENMKTKILKEKSLIRAHSFCVIHGLSAQQYGPLIELYIRDKFGFQRSQASARVGDCKKDDIQYEIKTSLGGREGKKFNFVQIRLNHSIQYYLLFAYYVDEHSFQDEGELFIFKLSKSDMCQCVKEYGGYAHGTIAEHGKIASKTDEELLTGSLEYALRPVYGTQSWTALLSYRIKQEDM